MSSFKTPKGTQLPMLQLKGKDYLQVAHRLVWFREEKPEWTIETEFPILQPDHSLARATIKDEKGRIIATAHKREDAKHFLDHAEKAETGAIGRALALIGYGTQFAPELDEGERIVDSPLPSKAYYTVETPFTQPQEKAEDGPVCCGKPMFISKYIDQNLGHKPWYCASCKKKLPRE